jgi:hypothetical protein
MEIEKILACSRPAWAKSMRPHLNQYEVGMVAHSCHPSDAGSINRKIKVQPSWLINMRP